MGGGSVAEGVRWGGGFGGAGVRVDVNAMLGIGVMWGMGDVNQEKNRRYCTMYKKVLYNIKKMKKCGVGGGGGGNI